MSLHFPDRASSALTRQLLTAAGSSLALEHLLNRLIFFFFRNRISPLIDFVDGSSETLFIYLTFVQPTVGRNADEWTAASIRDIFMEE